MSLDNPYYLPPPYVALLNGMEAHPIGTAKRDVAYMMGHEFFFLCNAFNVFYILVFEYYVFRRLQKNYLLKVVFAGCLLQALSCITTLIRYNMGEEFNWWAIAGVFTGNAAFGCINAAITVIFCEKGSKPFYIIVGVFATLLTISSVYTLIKWEDVKFDLFRMSPAISLMYNIAGLIWAVVKINKAESEEANKWIIKLFGYERETVKRLTVSLLTIAVVCMGILMSKTTLITYGATGLGFFCVSVIFFSHVGYVPEEEFYGKGEDKEDVTNENTRLVV
eukprot:CAMPEP_0116137326 /NCGR_PEP_ID=MMETSP0329-20121206/12191_1 /TAXON_ID=697910 /ORGANISM="Pseudo-nitzschia arenysensis, Strain B593" /LENGTH=277 /DNA_ID=CAMNT_0003632239 /DNA_START=66 /DNA_END=899 /DNA_ORIENTATION=+